MLKYTLKNKKLEPSEELFFEELKLSFDGSSISGVLDNKYDLSDDETVQVINNNNKNVENLTLTSEKVLRQGWIYYMKEYQMYTVQCEFSSNIGEETVTNIYTIYYVIYNDSRYFQNYKIINDDSASSHIVFDNSFTISNVGTFSFSDNNIKYSRIWIPTKIYIEDGTIAIDEENTLYDGIDFNLLDTSVTYDEETKLYNSFINYNNISHPLFYYSVSNYRSVFKCVINSAKESNVIDVLSTYCAEKMDYINYNNEQCEIFKSVDGKYDFINVTKPIYRLYSGTGRYSDYEDYETCYSSATANGISVKNIVKIYNQAYVAKVTDEGSGGFNLGTYSTEAGTGRFWGVWNRKALPFAKATKLTVSAKTFYRLRRAAARVRGWGGLKRFKSFRVFGSSEVWVRLAVYYEGGVVSSPLRV